MTKTLGLLAHPLTLLAVALVALNDFVLKPLLPSWLTGKLSDFGMLFFLPLLLAGLLELILPRRWAAGLGFGLAGAGFVLLKAGPLTAGWLSFLPLRSIPDPTDLLALPALAASFWLWRRDSQVLPQSITPLRWRLLLISLASMVAVADAAMPDLGVDCLAAQDGSLYARSDYGRTYASRDGGFTWGQVSENWNIDDGCDRLGGEEPSLLSLPGSSVQYQVAYGGLAARSSDGGLTWQAVGELAPLAEPEKAYVRKTRMGNLMFKSPPLDALVDPASGNLILAMGLEGVQVVRPDATWQWAAVGDNRHASLQAAGPAGYLTLLSGELVLALLAGFVWLGTAALARARRSWLVVCILAWLTLAGTAAALHPEIANAAYTGIVPVVGLILSGIWAIVLLIGAAVRLKWKVLPRLPLALLIAALIALAYLLWALGILPFYWLAIGWAVVVTLLSVILLGEKK